MNYESIRQININSLTVLRVPIPFLSATIRFTTMLKHCFLIDYECWPTMFTVCHNITIVDGIKLFVTIQISGPLDIYLLLYDR